MLIKIKNSLINLNKVNYISKEFNYSSSAKSPFEIYVRYNDAYLTIRYEDEKERDSDFETIYTYQK